MAKPKIVPKLPPGKYVLVRTANMIELPPQPMLKRIMKGTDNHMPVLAIALKKTKPDQIALRAMTASLLLLNLPPSHPKPRRPNMETTGTALVKKLDLDLAISILLRYGMI